MQRLRSSVGADSGGAGGGRSPKRTLIITEIIAPYRIPVFNILAERVHAFRVLFLRRTNYQREWSIDYDRIRFDILKGNESATTLHAEEERGLVRSVEAVTS